jgi:hypothetical protein
MCRRFRCVLRNTEAKVQAGFSRTSIDWRLADRDRRGYPHRALRFGRASGFVRRPLCTHTLPPRREVLANPPETIDRHNPNPALRNRPLCGVTIGYGFRQLDEYRLGDGRVYDPLSAHVYRGYMMPAGPDTLKLRGYILFTLLGRTETWHRVEAVDTCK